MKKRQYRQKRRAEQAQATRQQIVQAAMELHEQLGPAGTSISAVAQQAGVQRLTVYRHFPDEASLFAACTSHWLQLHPPPAIDSWADCQQPQERTRRALQAFYRYYRNTEPMWRLSYRDLDDVEALKAPMAQFENYLDQVCDDLLATWKDQQKTDRQFSITLRHGLRFSTWYSLKQATLSDTKMVDLVMTWLLNSQ